MTIYYQILTETVFLTVLIANFDPLQWLIDLMPENIVKYLLVILSQCEKCLAVWISLFLLYTNNTLSFWTFTTTAGPIIFLFEIKNIITKK